MNGRALGVEHDGAHARLGGPRADAGAHGVGVREEETGLDPHDRDAGHPLVLGATRDVAEVLGSSGHASEERDVRVRGAVPSSRSDIAIPMNRPGSVSKTSTPSERGDRRDEVRPRRDAVRLAQLGDVTRYSRRSAAIVDELDHGGDHDRGERRLGQLLEQRRSGTAA